MDIEARRSPVLTGDTQRAFSELGYVVLRGFLSPADSDFVVDAVSRLLGAADINQVTPEEAQAGVFFRARGNWRLLPELAPFLEALRFGRVVSDFTGERKVVFVEDEVIVLAPGAVAGGVYARDPAVARYTCAPWVSAILALQKTGSEPVEIELLRGSQALATDGPGPGDDVAIDPSLISRIELNPGDLLLKHPGVFACFAAALVPRTRGTLWLRAGGVGLIDADSGKAIEGPDHPVIWEA